MRTKNVSHMDLKPQNILLASATSPILKIAGCYIFWIMSLSQFILETFFARTYRFATIQNVTDRQTTDRRDTVPKARPIVRSAKKGKKCHTTWGVYVGCSSPILWPWAHKKPLYKSVMHGQCDSRPKAPDLLSCLRVPTKYPRTTNRTKSTSLLSHLLLITIRPARFLLLCVSLYVYIFFVMFSCLLCFIVLFCYLANLATIKYTYTHTHASSRTCCLVDTKVNLPTRQLTHSNDRCKLSWVFTSCASNTCCWLSWKVVAGGRQQICKTNHFQWVDH